MIQKILIKCKFQIKNFGIDLQLLKRHAILIAMKINNIELNSNCFLAPMAGISDRPYRKMAKHFGAGLVFTELVSAEGLVRNSDKTYDYMRFDEDERPIGIQLFGANPEVMAKAAQIAAATQPDLIDLNFGCPVKKVIKHGAGAAILQDLDNMENVVKSVREAIDIPLWCKIRSGWNHQTIVAVEACQRIEEAGADAVTVHPRTRCMMFKGHSDWNIIRQVKDHVSVPVIGNGDINSAEDAKRMLDETRCDAVMIGRGAMSRPWLFRQCRHYLETGTLLPDPTFNERIDICIQHYKLSIKTLKMPKGIFEMRKHIGWYLKGMPGSGHVRQTVFHMTEPEQVIQVLKEYQKSLPC